MRLLNCLKPLKTTLFCSWHDICPLLLLLFSYYRIDQHSYLKISSFTAKANPTADIGIDFDDMNRKERRKEKSAAAPVISTVAMGKAMGAGSGIGRAGAIGLMAPPNPMLCSGMAMGMSMQAGASMSMGVGPSMGMGIGMGMRNVSGMGMGGYGGGMNQPMGMNMGMGVGMGQSQRAQMFPGTGLLPPGMQGGYNTMGMGGYASQQPYGEHR